jgi:hypothetical protein
MTKSRKRKRVHRVALGNPSPVTSSPITDDAAKVKSSATITSSTPRRPPTECMASAGSQCVRQQDGTRQARSEKSARGDGAPERSGSKGTLAHAVDDPDAGYTISLWENEAAMRSYETVKSCRTQSSAVQTFFLG